MSGPGATHDLELSAIRYTAARPALDQISGRDDLLKCQDGCLAGFQLLRAGRQWGVKLLRTMRNLLRAPEFGDEEQTRRAQLTMSVVRSMLALMLLVTLLVSIDPANLSATTITLYGAIAAMFLACAQMVRRGWVTLAGWVVSIGIWIVAALVMVFFGGLRDQNGGLFIVAMMVAGATLGARWSIAFAGAAGSSRPRCRAGSPSTTPARSRSNRWMPLGSARSPCS